jgi:hypothetical protein
MQVKAVCRSCRRPYLAGRGGLCEACRTSQPRPERLRCQCGKLAVAVIFAVVLTPEGEPRRIQLAVCRRCFRLEEEMEAELKPKPKADFDNPIEVIPVKSLPRAGGPLKGRKLA